MRNNLPMPITTLLSFCLASTAALVRLSSPAAISSLGTARQRRAAHGLTLSARPNLGAAFRLVASNCRVCVSVVFGWMSVWYSNDAMPATRHETP